MPAHRRPAVMIAHPKQFIHIALFVVPNDVLGEIGAHARHINRHLDFSHVPPCRHFKPFQNNDEHVRQTPEREPLLHVLLFSGGFIEPSIFAAQHLRRAMVRHAIKQRHCPKLIRRVVAAWRKRQVQNAEGLRLSAQRRHPVFRERFNDGHLHPVKYVQHLGVLFFVHVAHHLVALLGRTIGFGARNPAHLHFHFAGQRGVEAVHQKHQELGHVVLLKPGKQVHVLDARNLLHGRHKAPRRNDAVFGPQHDAQLVPLVQQHGIHFVIQPRLVFATII